MDPNDYLAQTFNDSVLQLKLSLSEVFNYLGLGTVNSDEIKLVDLINKDEVPIRIEDSHHKTVNKRLIASLELHTEKNDIFSKTTPYTPNNIYKILTVIDEAKNIIIDVSAKNIFITCEQMYATREEFTEYYRNDIKLNNSNIVTKKGPTKPAKSAPLTKISKMQQRHIVFEVFCKSVALQKQLPNHEHQTIYDSFQPPMTREDFYDELTKFDPATYMFNANDFFRDKTKIKIDFSKAARPRK